jgi:hypothetical protein
MVEKSVLPRPLASIAPPCDRLSNKWPGDPHIATDITLLEYSSSTPGKILLGGYGIIALIARCYATVIRFARWIHKHVAAFALGCPTDGAKTPEEEAPTWKAWRL